MIDSLGGACVIKDGKRFYFELMGIASERIGHIT